MIGNDRARTRNDRARTPAPTLELAVPDHSTRISEVRIPQNLPNRTGREIAAAVQRFGQSLNACPNARIVK
jgi:hypothetical protein